MHIFISHFTCTQRIEFISSWTWCFSYSIFTFAGRKSILMEADTVVLLQGICYISFNLKREASGMGSSTMKQETSLPFFELWAKSYCSWEQYMGSEVQHSVWSGAGSEHQADVKQRHHLLCVHTYS